MDWIKIIAFVSSLATLCINKDFVKGVSNLIVIVCNMVRLQSSGNRGAISPSAFCRTHLKLQRILSKCAKIISLNFSASKTNHHGESFEEKVLDNK